MLQHNFLLHKSVRAEKTQEVRFFVTVHIVGGNLFLVYQKISSLQQAAGDLTSAQPPGAKGLSVS
ncbi:hypothetical protein D7V86_07390 [bacterium D16-51]|nr:hypothetical protein D7V96_10235 [bacterium D16-59]RKI60900.1 hypothetical protein D7V86_07390 [bacterium D16-51]